MWTNVFKIGGLHQVSWFQFLPNDSEFTSLPDQSVNADPSDAATLLVLSSHLQLQMEGFLSTWTNSFIGPWDPSQGLHNPDEKIKLWLFVPGRHTSVVERAKAATCKLRVLASGVWLAPGDSEEIGIALSQALRNCIERALLGLSYMRFGDVFSRFHPSSQGEELFRSGQPVIEFIFSATEEAVFVHVVISAKHIRSLSNSDMEMMLRHSSTCSGVRLPVVVSPHGMRGRLTGFCPGDLVTGMYSSSRKVGGSLGIVGLPYQVSKNPGCQLRGQNCYLEVTLGCGTSENDKTPRLNSNSDRNYQLNRLSNSSAIKNDGENGMSGQSPRYEKTYIYPAEAVLVPVVQTSSAGSSLKRFWLQNWMGPSFSTTFMPCDDNPKGNSVEGSWLECSGICCQRDYHSSGNSNSKSISSASTSSGSDYKLNTETGDLEADADSLTCRQSDLSSTDQLPIDGQKSGSKRSRVGMTGSSNQTSRVIVGSMKVSNPASDGFESELVESQWDWDDDDRGIGMDIQALLSEFGDFGDFFENDALPFGEPPRTEESQGPVFSTPDCIDVGGSPATAMMDASDQILLPVGFSSFESFNQPPPIVGESLSKIQEVAKDAVSSGSMSCTHAPRTSEFSYLLKTEALMTFAPEYGAVEMLSEVSSFLIKTPYIPNSRKVDTANLCSSSYVYSATPPSPHLHGFGEKPGIVVNSKASPGSHDKNTLFQSKKYYTHVERVGGKYDVRSLNHDNSNASREEVSAYSGFNSTNTNQYSVVRNVTGGTPGGAENFFLSMRNVIANEVECIVFQAFMCRLRYILLFSSNLRPAGLSGLPGSSVLYQMHVNSNITADMVKESIPVRIAGDIDGEMLDGPFNSPVGVWRPVGVPKGSKPVTPTMDAFPSLPPNSLDEEGILSNSQRQPLLELLNGMSLLVQQATSFVDVALDAECGNGPCGWLALQEQLRRQFSCGPSMVHAGCGGVLASCHSLDIAGVELVDPLSADVHASYVISLLQSDIKAALKSAFVTVDGPLSVIDWCKGSRTQFGDGGTLVGDGFSADSSAGEFRDSSSTVTMSIGEPISPSQSSMGASSSCPSKDGARVEEGRERRSNQEICISEFEQQTSLSLRPSHLILPFPAILVGYQDDWLKTSASSLQHWEKAPFEPYALQKHMSYYVVCPNIDSLTTAAADFFQQLGTVYETCKLGTHTPQSLGHQMVIDSGKWSSHGFVLLDCPRSMTIDSSSASLVGSISDYFLSLSNGWDVTSFLKSLSKVIYVVCPFPDPVAVLKTVVESCVSVGSIIHPSSDKDRRSALQIQVVKDLSCSTAVDESSSSVATLTGFDVPKLVLQVVTVDAIFRVSSPPLNEPVILKEIAFTVYNKARRVSHRANTDMLPLSSGSVRSNSTLMQINSPIPGMWKDSSGPRVPGPTLPREGELDASLRTRTWDTSWQTSGTAGGRSNPHRTGELLLQDELCYMFEPLFILAEPGLPERGVPNPSSGLSDDVTSGDTGTSSHVDGSETDDFGFDNQKTPPSLHCCYGWTEDWRWLVCMWTDARGELLDSYTFPFGGISSRQDTKGLQFLFFQILQQGCQILQACFPDNGSARPRDFVITRIGCFFELECQEWQKALYTVGGSDVKKWALQLRRLVPDGMPASSNGTSLQQQEMSLLQEQNVPSSPIPLYNPHSKASNFLKGGMLQPSARKQLLSSHNVVDNSKGLLQWVQSISFVSISVDHTLQLVFQAESSSSGATQGSGTAGPSTYLEGLSPVQSLGSASASYVFVPSPSMRFLRPTPFQLSAGLTSDSPPLAHLLHSKGSAIPLSTGFVVSKSVPSMRKDSRNVGNEEWPSVLSVSLVDHYGGNHVISQDKMAKGTAKLGGRGLSAEARDFEVEARWVLERVAAELHTLSWMTASPAYLGRRTALPFHCEAVLRLRRLLHFADRELCRSPDKSEPLNKLEVV